MALVVAGTDFIQMPAGTTAQRPVTPAQGMQRYNTDLGFTEVYTGAAWTKIAGATTVVELTSGTSYTIPNCNFIQVELWGGGGSGGRGASNQPGGGGGGGAYNTYTAPVAYFGSIGGSITYAIGAGGAGRTGSTGSGNNGGNTTLILASGKTLGAYGGGLGTGGTGGAAGDGGGGGGIWSAGNGTSPGDPSQTAGLAGPVVEIYGGGVSGSAFGQAGGPSVFGGGGGGRGQDAAGTGAFFGGRSQYGGGGGGGAANSGTPSAGGISMFGGAGSAGTIDANNSAGGGFPAGGSGGTEGGDSGAGGNGKIVITYW